MKYILMAEEKSGYPVKFFPGTSLERTELLSQEEIAQECAKSSARSEQVRARVLEDAAQTLGVSVDEAQKIIQRRLEDFLRKNPDQALSLAFGRVAIPGHIPYGHTDVR